MKKIAMAGLLIVVAISAFAAEATITSVSGSVEVKVPGGAWTAVKAGDVVSSRSMISTGFGSAAALSVGGMELKLQPLTRVTIDSLSQEGETSRTAVSLRAGRVRATRPPATRSTRGAIDFRVSTPVATAAVRGTDFEIGPYRLETYEGLVLFVQEGGEVFSHGGSYSWAVPGLRPVDPAELARNRWSISAQAGTTGDGDDGYSSGGSKPGRGWAQITLR